ncbi:hypothetical protein BH11MYX3_BH11MYX3_38810 [soil metagenome]
MSSHQHPTVAPFTQGLFYVATGLWPILHFRSFEKITGRKNDRWLAKAMGGLVAAVGTALIVGSLETKPSRALRYLGIGSAIAVGLADLIFTARGRVSKVYLADAAAEGAAVVTWFVARPRGLA